MMGLIGRKLGMTQILDMGGCMVPVTVIQAGPAVVTRVLSKDREGYAAVQLGFGDVKGERLTKPARRFFEKSNLPYKRTLGEFRLDPKEGTDLYKVGQVIGADFFEEGEFVDVTGISRGKGFQGTIKRFGHKGGPESHGSMYHRKPGSAGATTTPSHTWKGHELAGHMGCDRVTAQNLLVMKVMKEDGAILVRGAVPGMNHSIVTVRKALKRRKKIDLTKVHVVQAAVSKDAAKKVAKVHKGKK